MKPVLVVGGTGRTGRYTVAKLLAREIPVRVLARSRRRAGELLAASVEVVEGDFTRAESVQAAVVGVQGVVVIVESANADSAHNNPERVHYQGAQHLVDAASSGTHIVLVTQIYITRPERYPEVSNIIRWRRQAEEVLRGSGLPYTVVRPAWLRDDQAGGIRLEQGDVGEGWVTREDVAEACVQALLHKEAQGKTFEVYGSSEALSNWKAAFSRLRADPPVDGK